MIETKVNPLKFKGDIVFPASQISRFLGYSPSFVNTKMIDGFLHEGKDYFSLSHGESIELQKENVGYSGFVKRLITMKGFRRLFDNFNRSYNTFPFDVTEHKVSVQKKMPKLDFTEYVQLSEQEYRKLKEEYGVLADKMIEVLSNYKGSSGRKYKSDYLAIKNWVVSKVLKDSKSINVDGRRETVVGKQYIITLNVGPHSTLNPKFYCESLDELTNMMKFFFRSGYEVVVKEEKKKD